GMAEPATWSGSATTPPTRPSAASYWRSTRCRSASPPWPTWHRMVQQNLKTVIDAVGQGDADLAAEVWRSDRVIDDLYTAIFREVITYMMDDARNITPCAHLLFIAMNLERIGDHATNVAETVYYATGESLPDTRPKGDTTAYSVVRPKT